MTFDPLDYKSITVEDQRPLCLVKPHPHNHDDFLVGAAFLIVMLMPLVKFGECPKKGRKTR